MAGPHICVLVTSASHVPTALRTYLVLYYFVLTLIRRSWTLPHIEICGFAVAL